jgi:site-specific recombinase XerD
VHVFTFEELLTELFTERWSSPDTQASYHVSVRALQRHIQTDYPSEVTKRMVYAWRAEVVRQPGQSEGISPVSWNSYIRHLKSLYNFGLNSGYLPGKTNPFAKVDLKPPQTKAKTLPKGAIHKIRTLLREYVHAEESGQNGKTYIHPAWFWLTVVEMLYHTGIRRRQLVHIRICDIDLKQEQFICSAAGAKNLAEKTLPLHHDLIPLLERLIRESLRRGAKRTDQLFNVNRFSVRHRRETMNAGQIGAFFKRLSSRLAMKLSPHRCRHSFATELMIGERADIHLTQRLMCHLDIRSTMVYVDVPVPRLKRYLLQRGTGQDELLQG